MELFALLFDRVELPDEVLSCFVETRAVGATVVDSTGTMDPQTVHQAGCALSVHPGVGVEP